MQPQFVKTPPTSTGQFICDDWCLNYKMYKIFSHTVAVAESNGKLKELISWYKKKQDPQALSVKTCDEPDLLADNYRLVVFDIIPINLLKCNGTVLLCTFLMWFSLAILFPSSFSQAMFGKGIQVY